MLKVKVRVKVRVKGRGPMLGEPTKAEGLGCI